MTRTAEQANSVIDPVPSEPVILVPEVKVYVSLTTIPPRMAKIARGIASLVSQTKRPERIFLCIPQAYRRFEMPDPVPIDLAEFGGLVEIVRCAEDYGPGTKLLGSLERVPCEPNVLLVLVDDDVLYQPHMLATFAEAYRQHPDEAASFCVYRYRGLNVGQGADGFALPANRLSGLWTYYAKIRNNPFIFFVDDLWISYYLWMNGISIRSLKDRAGLTGLIYAIYNDVDALGPQSGRFTRSRSMSRSRKFLRRRMGWQGVCMRIMAGLKRLRGCSDTDRSTASNT